MPRREDEHDDQPLHEAPPEALHEAPPEAATVPLAPPRVREPEIADSAPTELHPGPAR